MVTKSFVRVLVLSMVFCVSNQIFAMDDQPVPTPASANKPSSFNFKAIKTGFSSALKASSNFIFNGWVPTLAFLTGAAVHTVRNDRQAPANAFKWLVKSFNETPKIVAYPAAFLGACAAYEYYKPRFTRTWKNISNVSLLKRSRN